MKKLLFLLMLGASIVQAQTGGQAYPQKQYWASDYGTWQVPSQTANTYIFSPPSACIVSQPSTSAPFDVFSTNAPILIRDANPSLSEVVTPSNVISNSSFCGIIISPIRSHTSFTLMSATGGLQEVLNQIPVAIPYSVEVDLDRNWYAAIRAVTGSNAATIIAAVKGNVAAYLVDKTQAPFVWYTWSGTQYVAVSIGGGGIGGSTSLNHLAIGAGSASLGVSNATDNGTTLTYPNSGGIVSPKYTLGTVGSGNYALQSLSDPNGAYANVQFFTPLLGGTTIDASGVYSPQFQGGYVQTGNFLASGTVTLGTLQNGTPGSAINVLQNGGGPITLNVEGGLGVSGAVELTNGYGTAGQVETTQGAGLPVHWANPPAAFNTFNVTAYGAACVSGTDDTTAYQSTFTAASAAYASTGAMSKVQICPVAQLGTGSGQTTINIGSGILLSGPGSIIVPAQSANPLFLLTSTDNDTIDGVTITFSSNLTACASGMNNAACTPIRYDSANPGTGAVHHNLRITNNNIYNSGWGPLVGPQAGTDALAGILIEGNTIGQTGTYPPTSYQYNDGIHVGGSVSGFTITNNFIYGRGDAGVAISSELLSGSTLLCHDGTITGNVIYEGREGIDDSGCNNVVITGNRVFADISVGSSNPAFRSIYYGGNLPQNVQVTGNWFHNYQSAAGVPDNSAKFDCTGGCGAGGYTTVTPMYSLFQDNHVDTLYIKGSNVTASENYFADNGALEVDVDTANENGSYNDLIGINNWANNGTINLNSNPNFYTGGIFYSQNSNGNVSFPNEASIGGPQQTTSYLIYVPQGGSFGWSSLNPTGVGGVDTWLNRAGVNHLVLSSGQGSSTANGELDLGTMNAAASTVTNLGVTSGFFLVPLGTATSSTAFNSAPCQAQGSYWNGTAATIDYYDCQNLVPTGTNPRTTFAFTHGGSAGGGSYSFDSQVTAPAYIAGGTTFSVSGCGTATTLIGGSTAGTFHAASTTCAPVVTTGITAPHGYVCEMSDRTTPADFTSHYNTSDNATTATWPSQTVVSGDVMAFTCTPY